MKFDASQFKPHPVLFNGTLQTVLGRYWWQLPDFEYQQKHFVDLLDGDQLVVLEYDTNDENKDKPIAFLVHGLVGCYQSNYMIRMTRKLLRSGYRVFRVNLRGCGPGFGHAKKLYHSGRSEDIQKVLKHINEIYPEPTKVGIGFSLGANIVLKMAGEFSSDELEGLSRIIAICPPANLKESSDHKISKHTLFNKYFVRELKKQKQERHDRYPELPIIELPEKMSLMDFDEMYLAPMEGFDSAYDYYEKSSSEPLLGQIKIPSLILHSDDDPCIDGSYLDRLEPNPFIDVVRTQKGGHLGFIDRKDFFNNFRWMDSLILDWMDRKGH